MSGLGVWNSLFLSMVVLLTLPPLQALQSLLRSRGALMEGRFRWNHVIAAVVLVVYVVFLVPRIVTTFDFVRLMVW